MSSKRGGVISSLVSACILLTACSNEAPLPYSEDADSDGYTSPTLQTIEANTRVQTSLPLDDDQDFKQALQGLIAQDPSLIVANEQGRVVWDIPSYDFVAGPAPDSVNPSLWRQATLNNIHGLFKVSEGIYQLRGFDLANMTIIDGKSGWIVVDPLTTKETAARALQFARQHLDANSEKPIRAVIFTHSHVDHFGGVQGILPKGGDQQARIIVPAGFMEEATAENVLAGTTMARRSDYMYGRNLPKSERGHIDSGLGKAPAFGTVGILPPTDIIRTTGQEMVIDGVRFVFQMASGSEAPAEFTFYLPDLKAFCGAEVVSRNMHNLYTLRGAKVRNALAWSGYIDEAKRLFQDAEVYFASHHWPIWGQPQIQDFFEKQRDTYKYIHDQTLRLAYHGYTPLEIAEQLELPAELRSTFSSRGYYGTLHHNSRAVYQYYFGWYDGNPANLNPLPAVESAGRYVAAMGGAENVLKIGQSAFDNGEYRWAAQILNHLVYADSDNRAAKGLLAKVYDQLGYQAESGPWRDVYLTGAYELRHGMPREGIDLSDARDMITYTPREHFFNKMAAQLNGPEAEGVELTVNFNFTDLNENHVLTIKNSVLNHRQRSPVANADVTVNISHSLFLDMALGTLNIKDLVFSDQLDIAGSKLDLIKFFSLQDKADLVFPIVEPRE